MRADSPFRRSLPVTATSFINKAGTIGLSIIPVILVERHLSPGQAATVMGVIKTAGFAGILIGGWCCDTLGLRATLLLSFLISGLGMAPLPFAQSALLLATFGALAQLGTAFYYSSARLLITQLVPPEDRSEAIAWQRTSSNFAQILSYSLGAALGRFGTTALLLFDSFTSFLAAGAGSFLLPGREREKKGAAIGKAESGSIWLFFRGALIVAIFYLLYELWAVTAAAKCKLLFGTQGLQIFSQLMILNTLLCALLSVFAARFLRNAAFALPMGLVLEGAGLVVSFCLGNHKTFFFAGALLVTFGEIVFNSLSALVLIQFTPAGKNQATRYSSGVMLQFGGRIVGAVIAFPLVVNSPQPVFVLLPLSLLGLGICYGFRRQLAQI